MMKENNRNERDVNGSRSQSVGIRDGLTYLLAGAGIGAALALLFAPKPGNELRSDIADVTRKGYDATIEKAKDLKLQSADVVQTVKEKGQAVYDFAASKINSGNDAVSNAVDTATASVTDGIERMQNEAGNASNARSTGRKSSSIM